MTTPYIGYSNEMLTKGAPIKEGDFIRCPRCMQQHLVRDSWPAGSIQWYRCDERTYLCGIAGHSVMGTDPDATGGI